MYECVLYITYRIILIKLATVSHTKVWRVDKREKEEADAIAAGLPPPKKYK